MYKFKGKVKSLRKSWTMGHPIETRYLVVFEYTDVIKFDGIVYALEENGGTNFPIDSDEEFDVDKKLYEQLNIEFEKECTFEEADEYEVLFEEELYTNKHKETIPIKKIIKCAKIC